MTNQFIGAEDTSFYIQSSDNKMEVGGAGDSNQFWVNTSNNSLTIGTGSCTNPNCNIYGCAGCLGGTTGTIWTNPPYPSTTSSITFSSIPKPKYSVLELPLDNIIPNKVYVCGRLVTVGILGSDVQAAFNGKNKLIFSPGEIGGWQFNDKITISLDYGDWLYHYNVEKDSMSGMVTYKTDSNILEVKLVSKVAQR